MRLGRGSIKDLKRKLDDEALNAAAELMAATVAEKADKESLTVFFTVLLSHCHIEHILEALIHAGIEPD